MCNFDGRCFHFERTTRKGKEPNLPVDRGFPHSQTTRPCPAAGVCVGGLGGGDRDELGAAVRNASAPGDGDAVPAVAQRSVQDDVPSRVESHHSVDHVRVFHGLGR